MHTKRTPLPTWIITLILQLPLTIFGQQQGVDSIRVFFLGGQSNMEGFGQISALPDSLNAEFDSVWIFHGNTAEDGDESGGVGIWEKLQPGHGVSFSSNGKENRVSHRFGVELSFAKQIQSLYPGEKIALIKYARGGTSIGKSARLIFGSWDPDFKRKKGINQYDHFLSTLRHASQIKDIDGDGRVDYLIPSGILWMQGEADALFPLAAKNYYKNLTQLMKLMRAAFAQEDLPIVLGKITDSGRHKAIKTWTYGKAVQRAQEKFAQMDAHAAIVRSTEDYGYSDKYHYDSDGYIDLGVEFANAFYRILNGE